jgi:hypothetical protein
MSNDRTLVETAAPAPRAHGVPTLIALRPATLARFPGLAHGEHERPVTFHSGETIPSEPPAAGTARPGFSLSPAQLAARRGCGRVAAAPLAAVVMPRIDPDARDLVVRALSAADGGRALLAASYGGHSGTGRPTTRLQAVMGAVASAADAIRAHAALLAARVPVYECRLGPDAYAGAAERWIAPLLRDAAERTSAR